MIAAALDRASVLGRDAVPLVQAAAVSGEPVVAPAAWRTLQQVDTSEFLDVLTQPAPPAGDVVGDQAAFALSVIAHRAGRSGFEPTPADDTRIVAIPADEDEVLFINTSVPTEDDLALLSRMPAGELYLVRPEREGMLAVECGDERLLLCIDSDIHMGMPVGGDQLSMTETVTDRWSRKRRSKDLQGIQGPQGVQGFQGLQAAPAPPVVTPSVCTPTTSVT